jgi:hypothetical protein
MATNRRPHRKLTDILGDKTPPANEDENSSTATSSAPAEAAYSDTGAAKLAAVPDPSDQEAGPELDQAPAEVPAPESATGSKPAGAAKKAPAAKKASEPRKAAETRVSPAAAALQGFFHEGDPVVLASATEDSERVNLYLHTDDKAMLDFAKMNDRADVNSRMRAMVAVYRSNKRFRTLVDKYAQTAPRGGTGRH